MKNNTSKGRTAVWLYPETISRMDQNLKAANCKSRSEMIEKALDFYMGYLESQDATPFLSKAILSSIQGTLQTNENRIGGNLFRLSVETSMMMHMVAAMVEMTDEELHRLRGRCVAEVKKTKGKISMDEAVKFQQGDEQ